jgi:alkylation response protein AidB-like acyl-CoA dehydrogenase
MTFILSEDETMLRDTARGVLHGDGAMPDRWATFAEMGWLMAGLPEEAGGLGWGPRAEAILAEELGRAMAPEPYLDMAVFAATVALDLAPALAAAIGSGERRVAFAHSEQGAGGEPLSIGVRAVAVGDGYRLDGSKSAVIGGPDADTFLISARLETGVGAARL